MGLKKSYPTKGSSSQSMRYIAAAGVASTPGIWWLLMTPHDDAPCFESPPAEYLDIDQGPSEQHVTNIISQEAYSSQVRNVAGVDRYDGTQLASNSPCEDQFTHGKFPSPWNDGNQWMAWAVFDGHSGWQTADLLKRQLLPFVRRSLGRVKLHSNKEPTPEDTVVQCAIKQGFISLDDSIFQTALNTAESNAPLQDKVKRFLPAYSGSCALLSLYDPITSTLHVACTGDSRTVLGQRNEDGEWEAIPLSVDQTRRNKDNVARLYNEHPGEEDIVKDGRVLGIMVSRAFGDSQWKWPLELQQDLKKRFYGPVPLTPKYDIRTPPYLTAEPVVTSTKINPSKPSFLIMATDGMWDMLSNEQAVNLVGNG
ncbi:Protein phosphatase 2C [Aspergillus sclerotialis]|uniref:Protein phosphatase 2C n=1 Tax=Aspergillus sclerotialis TaxID=2070753 RepID=A0A3A3A6U5_9EURO|nr:Protein phosphatase 2C [Aspergillus sclerotialis]